MSKTDFQTRLIKSPLLVILSATLVTACESKEDSHEDIVKADLLLIIDSLGTPCEQVLEYKATDELTYTVSCESGDRYLISVNPQGRVNVQNKE